MATANPQEFSTVIGADAKFKGELAFEGGVRVDGEFEGGIKTPGKVLVSQNGKPMSSSTKSTKPAIPIWGNTIIIVTMMPATNAAIVKPTFSITSRKAFLAGRLPSPSSTPIKTRGQSNPRTT